jgi:nucleoside-diphosphate-sugar epimerase
MTTAATVLVTGVTGFVGGAAVAELLTTRAAERLLLLVRADSPAHAAQRAHRSLARFLPREQLANARDRLDFLPADLTCPGSLADSRLVRITHVLHAAANTSFRSVRGVRQVNILGTLALVHHLRRVANLERFLHVSTAYLCGDGAPSLVHEDDFPRPDTRHLVEYTASKAEVEVLLGTTAPELPIVVARPSIVVGHSRLGCAPSASLFWYYRCLALLGRTPFHPQARRDIVPVDFVASTLSELLYQPRLAHRCYHISAGDCSAAPWPDVVAQFGISGDPIRQVTSEDLRRERGRLRERLGEGDEEHLLTALEVYFRLGASGVEVFDNNRLLAEGLPAPPPFPHYLPACLATSAGRSVYDQMRDDD